MHFLINFPFFFFVFVFEESSNPCGVLQHCPAVLAARNRSC